MGKMHDVAFTFIFVPGKNNTIFKALMAPNDKGNGTGKRNNKFTTDEDEQNKK